MLLGKKFELATKYVVERTCPLCFLVLLLVVEQKAKGVTRLMWYKTNQH